MSYITPIHPPSSVRHAIKLNFLKAGETCLVVAKSNRLEFYELSTEGLTLKHSKVIYGQVVILNKLRPSSSPTDHLFVATDRFMYFTLSWDASTKQLRTETSYTDQAEKSARDSQLDYRSHTDPSGKFMTLEWYEGVITVLPVVYKTKKKGDAEIGSLMDPIPSRISEFFIRSSTFIRPRICSPKDLPKLALLYEDAHRKVRLRLRQLTHYSGSGSGDPGTVDLEEVPESFRGDVELGSSHLIPVSEPACGLLILGETSITYWEPTSKDTITKPLEEATIFIAWEQIDDQRFVLADEYGKLYLLMLEVNGDRVSNWKLDVIGETSRASVLTYLDAGTVFVGSHQGDSQVIRITPQSLEVIQTFPNIGPIFDFTIMDMGNRASEGQVNEYSSGQALIVTGSGGFKDGSLRSVRSGVGMDELGILGEMENITNLFDLRSNVASELVETLVVSFIDETRVFQFDGEGNVEELEDFKAFEMSEGTLLAANVAGDAIIQVTESSVKLFEVDGVMTISEWFPPESHSITAAVACETEVLLTIAGTTLTVLDIKGSNLSLRLSKEFPESNQIACVTTPISNSSICVVGFWQTSAISVLDKKTLEEIQTEQISDVDASVPRSMVIVKLIQDQPLFLFVAMADGHVVTYNLDNKTGALSGKKSTILGTQQAKFRVLPREDGLDNVFVSCDHPSLIYGYEGRVVFSAITAENAMCVCPFNTASYPGAIAVATKKELKIALIDEERTTHVQKLHMGETVRRIAHSPGLKAFGLGTLRRTLENGVEIVQSNFKLAGEVLFNILHTYPLNDNELVESVMSAKLVDGSGRLAERFVVGTAYLDDDHGETVRGRIIIFETTEDRMLKVVTELSVKAACRCLAMVSGYIVAALVKTVVIYSLEYETASKPFLVKQASYRTSTAPIDVCVAGNSIICMDLMKSVSVLKYKKGLGGQTDTLEETSRHFQTVWGTCVAHIEENVFLASDAEGNLILLRQPVEGLTADDRRRLQAISEISLGELVNRIRTISVKTAADAVVVPRAFLATVEGSIYLFATISPAKQDLLMRLQSSMATFVQSPGNVPFAKYRAYRSQVREEIEPYRFVDGELIERFLDCSPEVQKGIVEGLAVDVEEVKTIVEGLRRLR